MVSKKLMIVRRAIPAILASFLVPTLVFAVSTISTNISTDGTLTTNGNTTLVYDATVDTVTLNARFASTMNPSTNNARDLGAFGTAWRDIYASSSLRVGGSSASSTLSSNGNITAGGLLVIYGSGTSTFASNAAPTTNNAVDVGGYDSAWRSIYASGTLRVGGQAATTTADFRNFAEKVSPFSCMA